MLAIKYPLVTQWETRGEIMVEKEKKPRCPVCGSEDVYGISRVVGYYSRIDNWNVSKRAELKDRQKGNYRL